MKSIISSHNKQILTPKNKQVGCNCRVKNSCPIDNKCLTSQLIYQADFKYVRSLRENNKKPSIRWKIVKIVYSKATSSFCKLCLTEKLFILNTLGDGNCLNEKTEFINKYRHQNKLLLKNVKDSMD